MSLVGTRPPTQEEVRLYEARHRMRLAYSHNTIFDLPKGIY